MSHPVVLVDEEDQALGTAEKLEAHVEGWLHRAFSVFLFNSSGQLLLQQRTRDKYHSGGLWSNTCCSHPRPGESPLHAAYRRLPEEMGFEAPLRPAFQRTYRLPVGDGLMEHEHNHVFVGRVETPDVRPNPDEVSDWTWLQPEALRRDLERHPERYTTWFRHLLGPTLAARPSLFGDRSASPERTIENGHSSPQSR